jgi:WD40 repeat protein
MLADWARPAVGVIIGESDTSVRILPNDLDAELVSVDGSQGLTVFDQDETSGRVLVGSANGSVALVDVDTATLEFLESADGELTAGAFSPDGGRVAVLVPAVGVQIFDVETGQRIGVPMTLNGVTLNPLGVHWAEDRTGVWVAANTGVIRFVAGVDRWREIACGIVNRELTADEWRTFVSETEPQAAACS